MRPQEEDQTFMSEAAWLSAGVAARISLAMGAGGLALGMWIMSTLGSMKGEITASSVSAAAGRASITATVDLLRVDVNRLIDGSRGSVSMLDLQNWALRLSLANRDTLVVPAINRE